jgi:tryptophanyl-tRNA synthetase
MEIENYTLFVKECKKIIKNNSPDKSVQKIAKLKLKDRNNNIGIDNALNIYKCFSDESVEWDSIKYANNITTYKKKVKKNVNNAVKYHKNTIKYDNNTDSF